VTYIYIPLKVSPGQLAVDFAKDKIDVVVIVAKGHLQQGKYLRPCEGFFNPD